MPIAASAGVLSRILYFFNSQMSLHRRLCEHRRWSQNGHKTGPLCKVKLKNDRDKLVVRSPEKAGAGGSTPSLATIFPMS